MAYVKKIMVIKQLIFRNVADNNKNNNDDYDDEPLRTTTTKSKVTKK